MSENTKPETLIKEMQLALNSLSEQLKPVKNKINEQFDDHKVDSQFDVKNGMSYLEMKYQLMNSYSSLLSFYCLLKVQGQNVEGHPVVQRLAHLKTLFEKLRPLDNKLQYQVDKLLRIAAIQEQTQTMKSENTNLVTNQTKSVSNGVFGTQEEMLQFKPNITAIDDVLQQDNNNQADDSSDESGSNDQSNSESDISSDEQQTKNKKKNKQDNKQASSDVYRAPKQNAVAYEDKTEILARKKQQYDKKRLGKTAFIDELRREAMDEPEELHMGAGRKTKAAHHEEIREQIEQENFKRIQLSKKEKKAIKKQYQDDFEDKLDNLDDDLQAIDRLLPNIMNGKSSKGREYENDDAGMNYSSGNFNKSLKKIKKQQASSLKKPNNKSMLGKRSKTSRN